MILKLRRHVVALFEFVLHVRLDLREFFRLLCGEVEPRHRVGFFRSLVGYFFFVLLSSFP